MTSVALHVGQLLQPVPGGIGRYVRALVRELPDAGVELSTFAAGTPAGVPAGHVDLGPPRGALRYDLWHRVGRPRVRTDSDVVHAPSLAVPPVTVPLVVTVHDVAFLRFPELSTRRGVRFHARGLELARRHAAVVVTPSAFTRDELVREGFAPERIHVAPHGAPPPPMSEPAGDAAVLHRLGVSEPFVLAVGTVEPRKQFDVAAAAVDGLAPVQLVIAGPPGWSDVPGLGGPRVRLLGAVDDPTLDALYRRARVSVVPSAYEGFGFPVIEAMARGCPVVASDASSLPEVAGGAGVLVAPGDVGAWRHAVERVVGDDDERARLAAAGTARAAEFTWARSAALHAAAYDTAHR